MPMVKNVVSMVIRFPHCCYLSQNLVPKPPQGPRPSREANIAKAEKKATEVIKARRSRGAKSGVKELSRQVVGMLALPQTLTTSYSEYSSPLPKYLDLLIEF